MPSPKQSGQPSGGMFQKYTGEQINQIPEGYVEGMGAMGKAYASIGQSIGSALTNSATAYKQRTEADAKIKGQLAPYLKRDPRVQMVDASISAGNLVKGEDGKIGLGAGIDESMLSPDARSSIDFYNKIGGDGSALSGSDLTKFATEFETEQKIASLDSEKADKAVDRELKRAQIAKLGSEVIKNTNTATNAGVIGAFASGQDVSAYNAPTQTGQQPAQGQSPAQPEGQPQAFVTPVVNRTGGQLNQPGAIDFSRFGISPVYTQDRANAGAALTTSLGQTPISASRYYTAPEVMSSAPAQSELPASASPEELKADIAMLQGQVSTFENSTNGEYNEGVARTVQTLNEKIEAKQVLLDAATAPATAPASGESGPAQQGVTPVAGTAPVALPPMTQREQQFTNEYVQTEQSRLTKQYNADFLRIEGNYKNSMARISATGATTGEIKALTDTYTAMIEGKRKLYEANYNSLEKGLAQDRTAVEFKSKFGEPLAPAGPATTPTNQATQGTTGGSAPTNIKDGKSKLPDKPFATAYQERITAASGGLSGGSVTRAAISDQRDRETKSQENYPAWWSVGVFTPGALQYQGYNIEYPSEQPLPNAIRAKVQDDVTGYAETRNYLVELYETIESGSDDKVRNFLDRSVWTTTDKGRQAKGDQLEQMGVASFRKGITSGGNFSDQDMKFVRSMLIEINAFHLAKDKTQMRAAAKQLASFFDQKYKTTLSANNVSVDLGTAREYLTRENKVSDKSAELASLDRAQKFYEFYDLPYSAAGEKSVTKTRRGVASATVADWEAEAEKNRKVGNKAGAELASAEAKRLKAELEAKEAEAKRRLNK